MKPSSFRLCPDRATIAVTTKEGTLLLRNLASKKELVRCPVAEKSEVVAVSADNKLAAVEDLKGNLQVWDLAARKEIQRFGPDAWHLEFALDGRRVAVGYSTHYIVWDLETKRELCRWEREEGLMDSGVAFSPDGRTLAIATCDEFYGQSILLGEIATGQERPRLEGHDLWINFLAFSPGGTILASGSGITLARKILTLTRRISEWGTRPLRGASLAYASGFQRLEARSVSEGRAARWPVGKPEGENVLTGFASLTLRVGVRSFRAEVIIKRYGCGTSRQVRRSTCLPVIWARSKRSPSQPMASGWCQEAMTQQL